MVIPALATQSQDTSLQAGLGEHPLKDAGCLGHIADEGDDGHSVRAGDLGKVPKRGRERLDLLLNQVTLPDLAAPESWPQAMPHSPLARIKREGCSMHMQIRMECQGTRSCCTRVLASGNTTFSPCQNQARRLLHAQADEKLKARAFGRSAVSKLQHIKVALGRKIW